LDGSHLAQNCLLKHVIEEKVEKMEDTKEDFDLKEMRRHRNLREEALDCTVCRILFGREFRRVARQCI
jgi:hypothetical protein